MKRAIITSFMTLLICIGYSQTDYSKSYINLGIGLGPNYGGYGTKTIIGYKNSGLLVGLGVLGGKIGYEVGGQISYKWLYANLGYGVYGIGETLLSNNDEKQLIKGGILMTGVMINIGKPKRCFFDLGIGYDWGGTYYKFPNVKKTFNTIDLVIGFGIRLGGIRK